MNNINDKATIIIRSVGERTEQLCQALILGQAVVPANVVLVRESPFSAAMRKSFAIGLERGLPWTFCVDADVLLRPGSISHLVKFIESQDDPVCEIQGLVLDKFFGGPRPAGNHLYRTCLLDKVIECIPSEGTNIRPEFHALEEMKARGYPWMTAPYVVGLHDYEQYNRDIFRKCFVQAHKHQHLAGLFLSLWRERAHTDPDYKVALDGFANGIKYHGIVLIDTGQDIYRESFVNLGIDEKEELPSNSYSLDCVEQLITTWVEPEQYQRQFPMGHPGRRTGQLRVAERIARRMSDLGVFRTVAYALGWLLKTTGQKIQSWVSD